MLPPPLMGERPDWSSMRDRRRKRSEAAITPLYMHSAPPMISVPQHTKDDLYDHTPTSSTASPATSPHASPAPSPSSSHSSLPLSTNRPSKYSKIDSKKYYTTQRTETDGAPPVPTLLCSACGAECAQPMFFENKLVIGIEHGKECTKRPHGYFVLSDRDKSFAAQWRISHRHARRQIKQRHVSRQAALSGGLGLGGMMMSPHASPSPATGSDITMEGILKSTMAGGMGFTHMVKGEGGVAAFSPDQPFFPMAPLMGTDLRASPSPFPSPSTSPAAYAAPKLLDSSTALNWSPVGYYTSRPFPTFTPTNQRATLGQNSLTFAPLPTYFDIGTAEEQFRSAYFQGQMPELQAQSTGQQDQQGGERYGGAPSA